MTNTRTHVRSALLRQTLPLTLAGAALCALAASTTTPAIVAGSAVAGHIAVDGRPVANVLHEGRVISLDEYKTRVEPAADRAGRPLTLVVDQSAVDRGYFVSFASDAAAQRYLTQGGMGRLPKATTTGTAAGHRQRLAELAKPKRQPTLNGRPITPAACGLRTFVYYYVNSSCGGSYISMVDNDYIGNMGTYGMNDKISSIEVGCAVSNARVWEHSSRGGSSTSYHGGSYYSTVGTWNDRISSAETDSSAAC